MFEEKLESAFVKFGELLDARFSKLILTSEDSVRYTFFWAICSEMGLNPEDIILEEHHPNLEGNKEIDMSIREKEDSPEIVCEFKYHRKLESVKNSDRTKRAGALFLDIFRLAFYKKEHQKSRCFLIYITDIEMANYLSNDTNRLDDFFNLRIGQTLPINEKYVSNSRSKTFVEKATEIGIQGCEILSCFDISRELQKQYYVRIFEIQKISET